MSKRKAQVTIFYRYERGKKHFLLLKTNKKRGEYWQNVTGSVDKDETYQEGALREAIEETGLKKKMIKKIHPTELCFQFHDRWGRDVKEKTFLIEVAGAFEVKIDRTISNPCLTSDITHASVVEASLGKRLDRCIEDRRTACSSLGALFR